jgi:hypothetical protein
VVAALGCVLRIADVLFHLDFEAGLEDLLGEIGKQAAGPDETAPVGLGLIDELLREGA